MTVLAMMTGRKVMSLNERTMTNKTAKTTKIRLKKVNVLL